MKKQAAVRPSKAEGIFGVVFGLVFVALGLFVVTPLTGIFGLMWTLLAAIITFYNAYLAFIKKYPVPEPALEHTEAVEQDSTEEI